MQKLRVTFFYADEVIFELSKKWRTRERIVKWADEFFGRFNFKIEQFPIPYNENVYRSKFTLAETNGPKAAYTFDTLMKENAKIVEIRTDAARAKADQFARNPPTDPVEAKKAAESLINEMNAIIGLQGEYLAYLKSFRLNMLDIRKLIAEKLDKSPSIKTNRQIVLFCEFENFFERIFPNDTRGETFKIAEQEIGLMLWNLAPFVPDYYEKPMIIIDILSVTKSLEGILAHELVHAAGNTTSDNQGPAKNIMQYASLIGRAPNYPDLVASDKDILKLAYFAI